MTDPAEISDGALETPARSGQAVRPRISSGDDWRTAVLFFLAVTFCLTAFSPAVFRNMGYTNEEMEAGKHVLSRVGLHDPQPGPLIWPRNGVATVAAHLPFLLVSHVVGASLTTEDWILSFEPILFTAGILTILFLWIRRINGSARWALALSVAAGFTTMLWPYAYIGLEVQQSFFLLLAGYLVLARNSESTLPRLLLFAVFAGLAISVKTAGTVLIPAVAFLTWKLFEAEPKRYASTILRIGAAVAVMGLIYKGNSYLQMLFWNEWGGSSSYIREWIVRDPVAFYLNMIAFIGSPNKGLIVFAPLAVLGLFALPAAWRRDRDVTIFAMLAFIPPFLGFSILMIWSDENWGPRYLHEAIAPLVLCLAIAKAGRPFRMRREIPLLAACGAGLVVSFLGAFFSYGALQYVASQTRQATLERFQSDLVWNHVRFNGRLLQVWLTSGEGEESIWTPSHHHWDFSGGGAPDPAVPVNLRNVAEPHSIVVRNWGRRPGAEGFWPWLVALACMAAAPVVLWRLGARAAALDRRSVRVAVTPDRA